MKTILAFFLFMSFAVDAITQKNTTPAEQGKVFISKGKDPLKKHPPTPDVVWGKLFTDVQLRRVLNDNKTFVDAVPKFSPKVILQRYNEAQQRGDTALDLKDFVMQNFKVPVVSSAALPQQNTSLKKHLEELWPLLTRKADLIEKNTSLLPLPKAYVVPGGRFREIYYWDSYFTMQGLAVSNRYDLIGSMLDNFKYLIDTYGHIPNGNRSYYLSRSQPPYFALMVDLLREKQGNKIYARYLSAMQKEYDWWMEGESTIKAGETHRRVVKLQDGTVLNRYYDDKEAPREESYYEDVQSGFAYRKSDKKVYTHLRAGAESGWDFSSRWLADTINLTSIETTDLLQVDLNCLMYAYEKILAKAYAAANATHLSSKYRNKAATRKSAIQQYFWSSADNYYFDYNFTQARITGKWSLAGVLPLFVRVATPGQASAVSRVIQEKFLKDGGVVTTIYHTGQQWDAPNGWAPLQYLTVKGLMNYKYDTLAANIAKRWMSVNEKVYASTGKMLEKYNVENTHLESGGGEYPTQDGFGWSNGVYLKFYDMFRR